MKKKKDAIIPSYILEDKSLGYASQILFGMLYSSIKKDDLDIKELALKATDFTDHLGVTPLYVYEAFRELEEKGYINLSLRVVLTNRDE